MDDTASLSCQFAVSVCNPIQIEAGYSLAPYSVVEYPDVGAVSANGFRTQYIMLSYSKVNTQYSHIIPMESSIQGQVSTVINMSPVIGAQFTASIDANFLLNSSAFTVIDRESILSNSIFTEIKRNSLGGMQFTTAIDEDLITNASASTVINRDLVLNNSIYTEINRDTFGRMQFLVSVDTVDEHNSQSTVAINTTKSLRQSVFTVINRSRAVRCQIYSQRVTLDRLSTQYFYKSPFTEAFHSEGYCTSPWPSTCWPYVDMFGWRVSHQTFWVLSHTPALFTQFRVAVNPRERVNFQYTGLVIDDYSLPTSVTIPIWFSLDNARPIIRSQFNITQANYLNTEVRWRPF